MFVNFSKNSFFLFLSSFSVHTSDERKFFKKRFVKYFSSCRFFQVYLSFSVRLLSDSFHQLNQHFFYHFFVVFFFFTYHLARTLDFIFIFSHFPPIFFGFAKFVFLVSTFYSRFATSFTLFPTISDFFLKSFSRYPSFFDEFIKHIIILFCLFFTRVFFLNH